MDKIVIQGNRPLHGEARIHGAKNAALLIQCAALLSDKPSSIRHLPKLSDIDTMSKLLRALGCDQVQGYWFPPAMNGDQLLSWLRTSRPPRGRAAGIDQSAKV